jgi:8-amino-7-oxononanoate synthase
MPFDKKTHEENKTVKTAFIKETLAAIRREGLYRENISFEPLSATHVKTADGRIHLALASNNYLGLTHHPGVIAACLDAAEKYGTGSGAARLVSGSHPLYEVLEKNLAAFKNTEAAISFGSGYMANIGVISALMNKNDLIFSDALNHASIIDGCRLSGAKIVVFPHADTEALERLLAHTPCAGKRLIVSDGVFSMDGDIAPLDRLVPLAESFDALLMVDDAHATGVLGEGRGTAHHFGLEGRVDVEMGTLSKALAAAGGYVAGSKDLISYLVNKARSYIFSTALPPALIAAAAAALDILRESSALVDRLAHNSRFFRTKLVEHGLSPGGGVTPIIPLIVGDNEAALNAARALREEGLIVGAIRPPTVPWGQSRLRLTVSAAHTKEELESAAEKIARILRSQRSYFQGEVV